MKVFFCDVCGVRVTDVDLSGGRGMRRRHDVICSTCLELGHGRQWAEDRGLSQRSTAAAASATPPGNPVIDAARDRASTMPDDGSLAAAASGFSALAPDAPPAGAPVADLEDAAAPDEPQEAPMPQDETTDPSTSADKQGAGSAKRSAARSAKSAAASKSQAAKSATTKSAKNPATARSARKAAQEKQKIILVTLVGLCVIMLVGLGIMLTQGGRAKAQEGKVIELSAERDKLFESVRATRDVAFRDPHDLPDADIQATIAKIHDLQTKVEAFEDFAKRGGWSEENVATQLEKWAVTDIYGKLKMWNDENAKRKMRALNGQ